MKTNVDMVRKLGQFDVIQRTKDGMFNATLLLKQWNEHISYRSDNQRDNKMGGIPPYFIKKDLKEFFSNKSTKDFISALIDEESLNGPRDAFVSTKGRNGRVWMHPLLFVKFAMWLNPWFEVKVLKFVYDELIGLRIDAGDNYKLLSASASSLPDVDYKRIAKALNYIVFNKHYDGIRQTATQEQLKELNAVQENLSFLVDMGFVKTFRELIETMRNMYSKKWMKF